MIANSNMKKQSRLIQDARTGSIAVTLPSKRRSEPDLTFDEESDSDEPACQDYEYSCTNLVSPSAHQLSDIHVVTMSGHEITLETTKVSTLRDESRQASFLIDPKALLTQRYPAMLPTTWLSSERVEHLALIAQEYRNRKLIVITKGQEE